MKIWFTSDTHFCHPLVAKLRGFSSVEAHDEEVIARWNAVVAPDDMVWHLGDVGLGGVENALAQASRLHGFKHLVTGNHDRCWPGQRNAWKHQERYLRVFESVQQFAVIGLGGQDVLLSHFPYRTDHTDDVRYEQFRLRDEGSWLVHGHTHLRDQHDEPQSVHVGLDAWGLRPVRDSEIAQVIRESKPVG